MKRGAGARQSKDFSGKEGLVGAGSQEKEVAQSGSSWNT
jgi:hypothetical protein